MRGTDPASLAFLVTRRAGLLSWRMAARGQCVLGSDNRSISPRFPVVAGQWQRPVQLLVPDPKLASPNRVDGRNLRPVARLHRPGATVWGGTGDAAGPGGGLPQPTLL